MSKPTDTWMPLYIEDYLRDTMRLNPMQHGVYFLLIMDYWVNGPPPDDDAVLATITKTSKKEWQKLRPILAGFFIVSDGVWRHKRIDAELTRADGITKQRQAAGRASGQARWGKKGNERYNENGNGAITGTITNRPRKNTPLPSTSTLSPTGSKEPERESRAREAPGQEALSQSVDKFEVSEELIAQAAEARAKVRLDPVNLHAEAAKFSLSHATQSPQGWLRWALIARADLLPAPNGHDPPFVYVPDLPKGPPPPFDPDEPTP